MAACFPTTCWSRVGRVGDLADCEARAALEGLCRDYWYPLYAFIRARGHSSRESRDLLKAFLTELLERGDVARLDQSNGRFRAFLRAACDHYLSDHRDQYRAAKRDESVSIISIDRRDAERRYRRASKHHLTPDCRYEREWASALLARVLDRLEVECVLAGNLFFFGRIRPALQKDGMALSYRELAEEFGRSADVVRGAARRIRGRYRELLREEVGRTIGNPTAIDEEIGELLVALAGD